jgi:hypothetical protein
LGSGRCRRCGSTGASTPGSGIRGGGGGVVTASGRGSCGRVTGGDGVGRRADGWVSRMRSASMALTSSFQSADRWAESNPSKVSNGGLVPRTEGHLPHRRAVFVGARTGVGTQLQERVTAPTSTGDARCRPER